MGRRWPGCTSLQVWTPVAGRPARSRFRSPPRSWRSPMAGTAARCAAGHAPSGLSTASGSCAGGQDLRTATRDGPVTRPPPGATIGPWGWSAAGSSWDPTGRWRGCATPSSEHRRWAQTLEPEVPDHDQMTELGLVAAVAQHWYLAAVPDLAL